MAISNDIVIRDKLYIGGSWVSPTGDQSIEVVNPSTEEIIGAVPLGSTEDVDRAVSAARSAFPTWMQMPRQDRAQFLAAISAQLKQRLSEIASTISLELGMPIALSKAIQARLPMNQFGQMPMWMDQINWEEAIGNSLVIREPVGVVAAITPWNYPLHQIAGKVAPALAAGCTVVLKPSSEAPMSAFILAEIADDIHLPPGVFNLVTGTGNTVGERLVSHAGIDFVSFTGSTAAGRRIGELAAQSVKPCTLELGGKSPNVILDDADLDRAVPDGVGKCFLNSGQTCNALTRMLVQNAKLEFAEEIAKRTAESFRLGDPFDPATRLGPVVSAEQLKRVRGYIEKGIAEGAKLITGGFQPPSEIDRGYFVMPTVFSNVSTDMTIAQEEIFGPVLVLMPYEDEQDAIRIANDTKYGLAAGIWSRDMNRAKRIASRLQAGQIEINGGQFNLSAPFGGYKQSGYGRENGHIAIDEFLQTKSLQIPS